MELEIKRKFLVKLDKLQIDPNWHKVNINQSYLIGDNLNVSVRQDWYTSESKDCFIVISGKNKYDDASYIKLEYKISDEDAESLFIRIGGYIIKKTRYIITLNNYEIKLDQYHNENGGLWLAEIDLSDSHIVLKNLPNWIGDEVTQDYHYQDAYLSSHPYKGWIRIENARIRELGKIYQDWIKQYEVHEVTNIIGHKSIYIYKLTKKSNWLRKLFRLDPKIIKSEAFFSGTADPKTVADFFIQQWKIYSKQVIYQDDQIPIKYLSPEEFSKLVGGA